MAEEQSFYQYGDYVISTLRDEGVWWATARPAGKSLGGDRAVRGGPWKNEADAVVAAEAFCNSGKAGSYRSGTGARPAGREEDGKGRRV